MAKIPLKLNEIVAGAAVRADLAALAAANGGDGSAPQVRKQVLASRLGMTKETFSRAMRTLSDEGLIIVDGAVVQIPDVGALEAYEAAGSVL